MFGNQTEKAETAHERRAREFEELRAEIEAMAEVTLDLEPGELYFPSIYKPVSPGNVPDMPANYGLTLPAGKLLPVVDGLVAGWLLGSLKPPTKYVEFDSLHVRSRARPRVYTIGLDGTEDSRADLRRLSEDLEVLDAQNRPRDHLFLGRRVRVTIQPYAYWSNQYGSAPVDRMGVGLGLRRVGVWAGEAYDGQAR